MKFETAFITKFGHVGMQFISKDKRSFFVWNDGDTLHFSEGFSRKDTEAAVSFYNTKHPSFLLQE